jgi:L-ascorbate metabolism protein UlaG (beta-lactamase superfamily)
MPSTRNPLRLTYIGGPTALLEYGGLRFLTDPTFDAARDRLSHAGLHPP